MVVWEQVLVMAWDEEVGPWNEDLGMRLATATDNVCYILLHRYI